MDDEGTEVRKVKRSSVSRINNTVKIFEEYEDGSIRLIIGFVDDNGIDSKEILDIEEV